jgi:hypothetical protein
LEKHFEYLKGLNGSGLCDCPAHENSIKPSYFWGWPKDDG